MEDGKFITSAGVSAGIDMALALVARLTDEPTARMVQLAIEYDPHPPFGGIDWDQVNRDIYEPMLGPMVQQQLADRPELLAKLSGWPMRGISDGRRRWRGSCPVGGLLEGLEALAVLIGVELAAGQPLGQDLLWLESWLPVRLESGGPGRHLGASVSTATSAQKPSRPRVMSSQPQRSWRSRSSSGPPPVRSDLVSGDTPP